MSAKEVSRTLRRIADPEYAKHSLRFFKTGKGEYGEGDKFLGIRVPVLRQHAKKYKDTELNEIHNLLKSNYHEERLCALFLLTYFYQQGNKRDKAAAYKLYLKNTQYINNWDLVDASAHKIIGPHLFERNRAPLYKLCNSKLLWDRRIAIISTYYFIKNQQFDDTLALSEILLDDEEDLMHKAVGWMLREVGKHKIEVERKFLKVHYKKMPRTMLRYAIERFPERERKKYLQGDI